MEKCQTSGQEHLLKFYEELDDTGKQALLEQIHTTDFEVVKRAVTQNSSKGTITPIKALTYDEIQIKEQEYRQIGLEAIKKGKVAAVLLAGGMGTRLGSDDPKGMYNIGISHDLYIFECLINNQHCQNRTCDPLLYFRLVFADICAYKEVCNRIKTCPPARNTQVCSHNRPPVYLSGER